MKGIYNMGLDSLLEITAENRNGCTGDASGFGVIGIVGLFCVLLMLMVGLFVRVSDYADVTPGTLFAGFGLLFLVFICLGIGFNGGDGGGCNATDKTVEAYSKQVDEDVAQVKTRAEQAAILSGEIKSINFAGLTGDSVLPDSKVKDAIEGKRGKDAAQAVEDKLKKQINGSYTVSYVDMDGKSHTGVLFVDDSVGMSIVDNDGAIIKLNWPPSFDGDK